jgi:hypothetical protein
MSKKYLLPFFSLLLLPILSTKALSGGGLVYLTATPTSTLKAGEYYFVSAEVFLDNSYQARCQSCPIEFKFQEKKSGDSVNAVSTTTDPNGFAAAKMTSGSAGERLVYADVKMPDGTTYTSSVYLLYFDQPAATTVQVNPQTSPKPTSTQKPIPTPKSTAVNLPHTYTLNQQASAEINQKVDNLQQQLDESLQKQKELENQQSVLLQKIEQLTNWIKSIFPFLN